MQWNESLYWPHWYLWRLRVGVCWREQKVQQMTDGRWGWGCKLNAIYCCVYQRTGCLQGWRERGKGLQPDIMMKSQNKPGKADIIQHTDISHMKVLEGKKRHMLYIQIILRLHQPCAFYAIIMSGFAQGQINMLTDAKNNNNDSSSLA